MYSDILHITSGKKIVNYKKSKTPVIPSMKTLIGFRDFESKT
jgi:hypothetical protein